MLQVGVTIIKKTTQTQRQIIAYAETAFWLDAVGGITVEKVGLLM